LKLTIVGPSHPFRGGIAHFTARLATELSHSDEVDLINFTRLYPGFLFPGKTQYDESRDAITFPSARLIDSINPFTWQKTAEFLLSRNPDAVIFQYWHPFFGPAYRKIASSLPLNVPTISICHNVIPHDAGLAARVAARYALGCMTGYVVHAGSEQSDLRGLFDDPKVTLGFHPLYDTFPGQDVSKEDARKELGIAGDALVVLYFGLIRPYKGVDLLLEAALSLTDIKRLKILIVGEIYSEREKIQSALDRLPSGKADLVDSYVPNEKVARYFRAADIVALPYKSATQSGVIPIAYACRRPVIATRVGGLPDVILDGESGYLVEPGDAAALARAIRDQFLLFDNPPMEEGVLKMCQRLSWASYADLIRRAIGECKA
jgi:glycosyltransferase involved in cell wall biosynthesis